MIKLPKHYLDRQNAIINAQNYAGRHTNYLNDVLRPAIERGNWDEFETLDIGFTITGESLGKIGDENAWRNLQSFFEPIPTKIKTLDFTLKGKVIERNLRNQLKALALKMIWVSPKYHSFSSIYYAITDLKKFILPLLYEGYNSFEFLDFGQLEAWIVTDCTDVDFQSAKTYLALNKLYTEAKGLPFEVPLEKKLTASDFGLSVREAEQYTVIPQRLYSLGLQKSEELINELYSIRDELNKLPDYISTYFDKIYQEYAKYLASGESILKNGNLQWYLDKSNEGTRQKAIDFQDAFLALTSPSESKILELINTHKPSINYDYIDKFHPNKIINIGKREISSLKEAHKLFKEFNGGCLWALQSRTGMRVDEISHLHITNGCSEETISKQTVYVIHADLSKTARGSQSKQDEFVTTEVGKKSYEILQILHGPLRKQHSDRQAFFHKITNNYGPISKAMLGKHSIAWFESAVGEKLMLTSDDLIDLKISDPNLSFNTGEIYKFSGHQLRRSFAYYLIGYELCAFPQLKQQFSHVSMAMTRHYAKNASKFLKIRKQKQNLAHAIDDERINQKAQVYLKIYKKLANKERVAGGKGKEFAKKMMSSKHSLFKDKVDADMLSFNYWKKQILDQKRHIHAVAPGVYCTSTTCSLRTQVNLLECVDCKNDYIVDAVFAEAKRKEAEIHMLWDIEHDELTPQTASEAYIKITAAERIMNDLDINYDPVKIPQEVKELLIPYGVIA